MAVQIDFAAVVDPLEIEIIFFFSGSFSVSSPTMISKMTAIDKCAVPADASGQIARATRQRGRQIAFDRPVVRQVELAPAAVVEFR